MTSETLLVIELKRFQRARGLSRREMAAGLGLHNNGLNKIFKGAVPRGTTLGKMARMGVRLTSTIVLSLGLTPRAFEIYRARGKAQSRNVTP